MRVSTRVIYGLRAMCVLALHFGRGPLSVARIAEMEKISFPYLEQLLNRLRKEGLVQSVRGAKGGYTLTKPPRDITVGKIVQALEGRTFAQFFSWDGDDHPNQSPTASVVAGVWERLQGTTLEFLERLTLQDLLEETKEASVAAIDHRFTFHI